MRAKVQGAWLLRNCCGARLLRPVFLGLSPAELATSGRLRCRQRVSRRAGSHAALGESPALSGNWGDLVRGASMATTSKPRTWTRSHSAAWAAFEQALAALEHLLDGGFTHRQMLPVDWARWQKLYPAFVAAPLLSHLVQRNINASGARADDVLRQAIVAAGGSERATLVEDYLAAQAARVLGLRNRRPGPAPTARQLRTRFADGRRAQESRGNRPGGRRADGQIPRRPATATHCAYPSSIARRLPPSQ